MNIWRDRLHALLRQGLEEACDKGELKPRAKLAFPEPDSFWVRRSVRGEYSSNVALVASRDLEQSAAQIAAVLRQFLDESLAWPGRVEEAKGFLNFHMSDDYLREQTERAVREGRRYGAGDALAGRRVNVEFVSAEPTGPLPLTAGRIAAVGEALCRLLENQGASVTREFFLNDAETSSKMRLLGESVEAFYLEAFGRDDERSEAVMTEPWVREVARQIVQRDGNDHLLVPSGERVASFARQARDAAVASHKDTLRRFGVHFDVWVSEGALRREGRVDNVLARLRERGYLNERDGAVWLRTTAFGDDANRSLVRANGEPTYLAGDIAYHIFKFERGFDRVINIWTAPHQAYIARTHAALRAAGYDTRDRLDVLTCESAYLLRDGTRIVKDGSGSSRELTLDEALRDVITETLRFLFLLPPWDETADIHVEVARRDDEKNPAYAARLLPSRLATMIREAEQNQGANSAGEYSSEEERVLARLVALWPDEAAHAAERQEPQRIARFVLEMATGTRALLASKTTATPYDLSLLRAAHIVATNALRVSGLEAQERF